MSKLPKATKRIGKHTYTITKLNAVQGRKELLRLSKIAVPFMAAMSEEDMDKGINSLATNLSEKEFDHFCDLFAGGTIVKGGEYDEDAEPALDLVFGEHFADNYFEMFEWLVFAIRSNFESFFEGAAAKMSAAKTKTVKVPSNTSSDSPKTSTTGSGG